MNNRTPRWPLLNQIATYVAFISCIWILPALLSCYICVQVFRKLWLKILSNRFPYFEFVETTSVRTLLDNHRNQGVINVLMTIRGTCRPILIQQALIERLIDKKDQRGYLSFPKLKAGLFSCWGNYAWKYNIPFNLENHFIVGKPSFRGRPLTDQNIQEYVNEIITKYLTTNLPPWQITVIPNIVSSEEKYCILIRVHHLMIANDEPLSIGDFLMLNEQETAENSSATKSALTDVIETPKSIPKLYSMFCDSVSNQWNEFVYEYDPIESPKATKIANVTNCMAIVVISIVSTLKELNKLVVRETFDAVEKFINVFYREISKRGLTLFVLIKSCFISLNPIQLLINVVNYAAWAVFFCVFRLPMMIHFELSLLVFSKYYGIYRSSFVEFFFNYVPLFYSASVELFELIKIVYTAPIQLIKFAISRDRQDRHQLQTVSLCGRKSIAWSNPVNKTLISEAAAAVGVSETTILFTIVSNCIREYFTNANLKIPKSILVTAKNISSDVILSSIGHNGRRKFKKEGILCFPLTIGRGDHRNFKNEALDHHQMIEYVRNEQKALYAISKKHTLLVKALPSLIARILLNYWSRKFSVTIIEISDDKNTEYVNTHWGDCVHSLLCWKPPQGNISMAIILQRYADTIRMGVIADSQLAPHHMAITRHWNKTTRRLIHSIQGNH